MSQSQRYLIPGIIIFVGGLLLVPAMRAGLSDFGGSLVAELQRVLFAVGLYF